MWKYAGALLKSPIVNLTGSQTILISTSSNARMIFNISSITNKRKVYKRKELVGYTMQQMFDVVNDVENYKSFVPYCKQSLVRNKTKNSANASIVVGFPPLLESYDCQITTDEPHYIRSECFDGRLFNYLLTYWGFSAGVKDVRNSCVIDFQVTFEFKSIIHSNLSLMFFDFLVVQMEGAFIAEAEKRYGKPDIKSHVLYVSNS